jgi:very-short-patch-repair endonuclease
MLDQIHLCGMPEPEQECVFAPPRKWRFDFAWYDRMLALEVEGGVWHGRHTTGGGFTGDCEKYNEALLLGWRVLRVAGEHVKNGMALRWVERALQARTP